jgi:hypothetical protein
MASIFSFFRRDASEARSPKAEVLPDSRKRLTRFFKFSHTSKIEPLLALNWGDLDPSGTGPTGWTGLRLTNRSVDDSLPAPGRDSDPVLVLVYEQISATAETQVGSVETRKLEDGRTAKIFRFVQFSANAYVPQTVGSTTAPGDASAFLLKEDAPDDGTVRRIERTYVYAGLLSQRDFTRGTIKLRTLVWAKTVPATPADYVSIFETAVENPSGYPTYTYTFAKITDADYSVQRYVDFTMVGRAKAYKYEFEDGVKTRYLLDVYMSPPITVKVKATISVAYSTTATISTPGDLWNPLDWAVLVAKWTGFGNSPHSEIRALAGYRSTTETAVTQEADIIAPGDVSIMGQGVFGGTTASLQVEGGPADPSGGTYTLDVFIDNDPAFVAADGTKYFRKTTVVATIPTQDALPV